MDWENHARIMFRLIDVNRDGALDQLELSSMLSDIGLLDGNIEQIFMQLDSNGDGQISEEEFVTGYQHLKVRKHTASKAATLKKLELDPKDADAWWDLGYHNGGTVAGQAYDKKACCGKVIEFDPDPTKGRSWYCIGMRGGGDFAGETLSQKECYLRALELDPKYPNAWSNLGAAGGGTVAGETLSKKECYVRSLELDPKNAFAWIHLGAVGGGTVAGETLSEKECYVRALELDPKNAMAWCNLGAAGGGTVAGETLSKKECYVRALELDPKNAMAWRNLGKEGGGTVAGETLSKEDCYWRSLELDPKNGIAWTALGLDGSDAANIAELSRRKQERQERPKTVSERLGVCAQYIVGEFVTDARAAASEILECPEAYKLRSPMEDANNPNFYELAPVMCYGDKSKGHDKICPRDGKPGCAVVDALSMEDAGKAAETTHFLSWTWVYRVVPFTSSIDSWLEQNGLDSSKVFIWVCFFCNNQFRLDEDNSNDLDKVFTMRLQGLPADGGMIAMLDRWRQPVYLTRVWCIFEQFKAGELRIQITMILPPDQDEDLKAKLEEGKSGIAEITDNLSKIDAETAEASVKQDEVKVKNQIRSTVGFDAVNTSVKKSMKAWCASVFTDML